MPGPLENLPLQPLVEQLEEILELIRVGKNQQAQQKLQQARDTYKAICFECRIVQYPKPGSLP
jgi:hypothetical protein